MDITEVDIQNTVLELFGRKGLVQGDVMWLSRLVGFWTETRLRRSDLLSGIAQLCSKGLIDIEEDGAETCLSLTQAGEDKTREILREGADYWSRHLREELLPAVRVRKEQPRADGGGRRDYEAHALPDVPFGR